MKTLVVYCHRASNENMICVSLGPVQSISDLKKLSARMVSDAMMRHGASGTACHTVEERADFDMIQLRVAITIMDD